MPKKTKTSPSPGPLLHRRICDWSPKIKPVTPISPDQWSTGCAISAIATALDKSYAGVLDELAKKSRKYADLRHDPRMSVEDVSAALTCFGIRHDSFPGEKATITELRKTRRRAIVQFEWQCGAGHSVVWCPARDSLVDPCEPYGRLVSGKSSYYMMLHGQSYEYYGYLIVNEDFREHTYSTCKPSQVRSTTRRSRAVATESIVGDYDFEDRRLSRRVGSAA